MTKWLCRVGRGLTVAIPLALLTLPAGASADPDRFEVQRIWNLLIRVDSATGQVWSSSVNGDGDWSSLGSAPASGGLDSGPGRYFVKQLLTEGPARNRGDEDVLLIRLDGAQGRAWVIVPAREADWREVEEPS